MRIHPTKNRLPGRERLPQSYVDEGKRVRCVLAVAAAAHENGTDRLGTNEIIKRAQISRSTFYNLFDSLDEALMFSWHRSGAWLSQPVTEAVEGEGPWEERAEAGIDALLGAIAEHSLAAELYLVHAPCLVGAHLGIHSALLEPLSAALAEGLPGGDQSLGRLPELAASGVVSVIAMRLRQGEADRLPELRDELVTLAFASVGADAEPAG